mmetsp:Transcript_14428/g.28858  ORF Transcript_14428/g.28858 Transcript_14428/m.28858 type:complete len:252 (-) Transcript_14428:143-898(-)|eukprot:CAMPEP_0194319638 /NCGR_PEP_ID=MMETSP0171-20130528/16073_1 /TAXON_ID=218684 /ORGANISM="Corethron pennatum, Strain L29A3" /LENGTH=251 /DNA_ID=CAMNT_0039076929 /DNA_START=95 /DNA_END=850 /DNA_ORIENTATION=-
MPGLQRPVFMPSAAAVLLVLLLSTSLLAVPASAFAGVQRLLPARAFSYPLSAKKGGLKRRRRKTEKSPSRDSASPSPDPDELPDFDLAENEDEEAPSAPAFDANAMDAFGKPVVTPEMMGDGSRPEQIPEGTMIPRDRSLESNFEFDNKVETLLPRGPELMKGKVDKRARKEAAIAASQVDNRTLREKLTPKEVSFFGFLKTGEDDPWTKLLENGTWFCIYALVAWEFYINSPLFKRSAELIPVVFEEGAK